MTQQIRRTQRRPKIEHHGQLRRRGIADDRHHERMVRHGGDPPLENALQRHVPVAIDESCSDADLHELAMGKFDGRDPQLDILPPGLQHQFV